MPFSSTLLQHYLPQADSGVWWVALSGGLDSSVLLHALVALKLPVTFHALHINHQISPNANDWEQHCNAFCAQLNVPFSAVKVKVINSGRGIEDAARDARYAVFKDHVKAGDYLLTAHHADDQSETLLLRLMRGTGPRGLAAMAQSRVLGDGTLHRPLLNFTRAELEEYASAHHLRWVDDESNSDDDYDRNFLRNQVMPLLRERWPRFAQKWQQTAELCASNEALIEELAAQDLMLANHGSEFIGTSISLAYLQSLSMARRQNLLRHWLRSGQLSIPEQHHFIQIEQQIILGREDAQTQVNFGEVSLRVHCNRLFALPLSDLSRLTTIPSEPATFILSDKLSLALPTSKALVFDWKEISQLPLLKADLPNLNIRFRQGGERCQPTGRAHSQTLKKLLQEYDVAPWLRDSLPLIYSGDQLVAVGDLWVCEGYQANNSGYQLIHLA
ncbi:MAG: tRNA lysidine(34) synthetase TilS [Gammaproteobacteria bacterium]|nr:MAG: tRNA lysidine(34) synthetase TilS [Gammaproteobacteria bacterium]